MEFKQKIKFLLIKISQLQCSSFPPLCWIAKLLASPFYFMFQNKYYKILISSQKFIKKKSNKKPLKSRFFPNTFLIRAINDDKSCSADGYKKNLSKLYFTNDELLEWSKYFMSLGRLDFAQIGFLELIKQIPDKLSNELRLEILRMIGITYFMLGNNNMANYYWKLVGQFRRRMFTATTPRSYRILGKSWFAAMGHIAMLDYYLKYLKLFFAKEKIRIVAPCNIDQLLSKDLMEKFSSLGINIVNPDDLVKDYDQWAITHDYPIWNELSSSEKIALVDEFWEYDFPDGEILNYVHAAARIQLAWEEAGLAPLFILSSEEKKLISNYLDMLDIPTDAWYVCLHVREGGFHHEWNSKYPSMRDADINNYNLAIEKIVDAGGWVLRMGDPSMKPLPPMHHVVDYAHSPFKSPSGDILLMANCRFMLGTNSGYALICSLYNVPCAFTNWVPIGWPLWPSKDLMIPKLFRKKDSGELLTLEQIFEQNLAFLQNWSDIPSNIELLENTPEEIAEITLEMLTHCHYKKPLNKQTQLSLQSHYKKIAKRHKTFTGSQLANSFLQKHSAIFSIEKSLYESI